MSLDSILHFVFLGLHVLCLVFETFFMRRSLKFYCKQCGAENIVSDNVLNDEQLVLLTKFVESVVVPAKIDNENKNK